MINRYLVGYDITSPKRLGRLYRRLKKYGIPIQYSLFLCDLTDRGLADCRTMIESVIDPKSDDVRIYPLPANLWSYRLGRAVFPKGILHTGLPAPLQPDQNQPGEKQDDREEMVTTDSHDFSKSTGKITVRLDPTARKMRTTCQTGQKKGLLYLR